MYKQVFNGGHVSRERERYIIMERKDNVSRERERERERKIYKIKYKIKHFNKPSLIYYL